MFQIIPWGIVWKYYVSNNTPGCMDILHDLNSTPGHCVDIEHILIVPWGIAWKYYIFQIISRGIVSKCYMF